MATRLIAVAIAALTLLPIANWLPGGERDPEYAARTLDWLLGLALCVGVGGLVAYIAHIRARAVAPPAPKASEEMRPVGSAGSGFAWLVALGAGLLYALIAQFVFSGKPLLIDEIIQVMQARWYAEGRLWVPTPPLPEFFSVMHLVDLGPKTYGQFPAGGPAMLALGSLVGAEWIVGPVAGALSVRLFAELLRGLEPTASRRWHRGTVLLFALAPFGAFMFGSHMNHATTVLWLLFAGFGLYHATGRGGLAPSAHPVWGLITGLGLGIAATIRPLDGVVFAVPAGVWLLWRARDGKRAIATLLLSGLGIALPIAALLWVNQETTGAPLLFGYIQLWGAAQEIGFHAAPWGPPHTLSRGLELISLNMTRLSTYLFETPFPAMAPAVIALWRSRTLSVFDRYLLACAVLLILGYGGYWHDGLYLGPRFWFPLLPIAVLWSARVALVVPPWVNNFVARRTGMLTMAGIALLYSLVTMASVRVPQYRNNMFSIRADIGALSRAAGVRDAVVLVKESWGAQVMARLWRLQVPRSDAEQLVRTTDLCTLERTVSSLERDQLRGGAALGRLQPLQRDSALLIRNPYSPDKSQWFRRDVPLTSECVTRVAADQSGFAHLAPMRLAADGNEYVRWLPGRELDIVNLYPGRPVYLLSRTSAEVDAEFVWSRIEIN
jgi:hypothetical protein